MALERVECFAAAQVPEPQRVVKRGRHGAASVRRYCHGQDIGGMVFERAQCLAALQVPEPQRVVSGGGDGTTPVRRYRHGIDRVGMAFEGANQRTSGRR